MESTSVIGILFEVQRDVLVESIQPLVALLSGRSDAKGMIVSPVGLVVDEGVLVGGEHVSRLTVVVPSAVEKLAVAIGERLRQLLTANVHVGVEVGVSEHHSGGQPEPKGDRPNVVVTGYIVEQRFETSSDRPLP